MIFKGNFFNGRFVPPRRGATILSENPGDLDHPIGTIASSIESVPDAVGSACRAFRNWSALRMAERKKYLKRLAAEIQKNKNALAMLVTREMGKTLSESESEVDRIVQKIKITCDFESRLLAETRHEISHGVFGAIQYRPRGVIVVISPFNVPAYLGLAPTASALAVGNTVILKPSELAPFVGQFIAEIFQKAGFPSGVFNLLQGGGDVGEALVTAGGVDGVMFTGSWQTGSRIQEKLIHFPEKICALEMGGKNAAIILKDADLSAATEEILNGAFMTTGQRCNATSRVIIEKPLLKKFLDDFLRKNDRLVPGYGEDQGVSFGPLVSAKALSRAENLIGKARGEGFEILRSGGRLTLQKRGYYLKPSVHFRESPPAGTAQDGTYTDEEIFAPDVAIYAVKNLDEAIELNNRPRYGLVTALFTHSKKNFEHALAECQTGLVNWNVSTTRSSSRLPFGGLKRSGNHHPAGFFSPFIFTIPTAVTGRPGSF